jgi:hypothetical protein
LSGFLCLAAAGIECEKCPNGQQRAKTPCRQHFARRCFAHDFSPFSLDHHLPAPHPKVRELASQHQAASCSLKQPQLRSSDEWT